MSDVNEHLERLMVRSLDGALSEGDELALNRELIRNPEARRLIAEYRAVDELSIAAMDDVTAGATPVFDAKTWTRAGSSKRRTLQRRTWFWLAPGAIAAALLALIVPKPSPIGVELPPIVRAPSAPTFNGVMESPFTGGRQDMMRSVRSTPAIHRNTGREIIGVVGDDGNLYWIEVERTRTVTLPAGTSSQAGTDGDL
jgi:anti-sigma factor RsiW